MTNDKAGALDAGPDYEAGIGSGTDAVHDPTSRWERRFCVAVFVVAAAVGLALIARGEPLPGLGPVLLLAVLVGLSVNLGALFPSEFSATADIAILVAAVVGFAVDAPLLGPFVVGLLMGPLDWVHWKQRLFYRMAYNSGSQSLCILLAAIFFRAVSPAVDNVAAVLAVAAAAAVIWMMADVALVTVVLVRRGGTSTVAAARHVLVLNAITVPLALVGAAAGMLALQVGWWAAGLVLAPMPFVPDLVLVRARRAPVRRVLGMLRLPLLVAALVSVGVFVGGVDRTTLIALVVTSVMFGIEARPDPGSRVAPILATVVIAAAVVVDGRDAFLVAVLLAIGGTGAGLLTRHSSPGLGAGFRLGHGAAALALGALAAVASTGIYATLDGSSVQPARAVVVAALAGIVFELLVVAAGSRPRRWALGRVTCSLPLVAVAAALAVAWGALGTRPGALVFGLALCAAMGAVAAWASPPWTSRWLARACGRARGRRVALAIVAVAAVGAAVVAPAITDEGSDRTAVVMLALAAAQADVAMAAVAVRQWRFAPRRRAFDAGVLALAGCGLLVGYPVVGLDGRVWSVALLAALLAPVVALAWPLGALADRAVGRGRRPRSVRARSSRARNDRRLRRGARKRAMPAAKG